MKKIIDDNLIVSLGLDKLSPEEQEQQRRDHQVRNQHGQQQVQADREPGRSQLVGRARKRDVVSAGIFLVGQNRRDDLALNVLHGQFDRRCHGRSDRDGD